MCDNKTQRFNLHFNLEEEDQRIAASILNGMGRKKTALVTRAILFLFENNAGAIDDLKIYDFSKTSDLMFRGSLNAGLTPSNDYSQDSKRAEKPKRKPPVKKVELKKTLEDNNVTKDEEENTKEKYTEVAKDNLEQKDSENNDILEGMLDSLESFF